MSDETSDRTTRLITSVILDYVPTFMHELPEVQAAVARSVTDIIRELGQCGWSRLSSEEHLARFKDLRDAAEMQGYQDGLNNNWNWGLSESNFWNIYKVAYGKGHAEAIAREKAAMALQEEPQT